MRDDIAGRYNLSFYTEGMLMLILKIVRDQAYVMELEHGKTGWISKEALTHFE